MAMTYVLLGFDFVLFETGSHYIVLALWNYVDHVGLELPEIYACLCLPNTRVKDLYLHILCTFRSFSL